jgi:OOP family OmpA-OmpF porin/outer membrane immunogenic protein
MKNKNLIAISVTAMLALPMAAMADTGLYIDGAAGQASVDDQGFDDNDTSFRIGAGWRFLENFGAEIGYQDLGKVEEDVVGGNASLEADGLYAGVSGKIPLHEGVNGFYLNARGGMYWWDATGRARGGTTTIELDASDSDFYVGVGAGYDFNEQFGVGVGFDRYQLSESDTDLTYDVLAVNGEVRF